MGPLLTIISYRSLSQALLFIHVTIQVYMGAMYILLESLVTIMVSSRTLAPSLELCLGKSIKGPLTLSDEEWTQF